MASRKKKSTELLPQADPKAPLQGAALLAAAQPVLKALEEDLLARADGSPGVTSALKERHAQEKKAERTADNYSTWRRAFIEQVAAAWFLSVVFVRVLEDRGLIERNRIAGPGALDSQKSFFSLAPSLSERDYLLTVFKELSHLRAAADLFDTKHNPVWLLGPSAGTAQQLLAFFREGSDEQPAFRFGGDTRFLGDLYQDLNEEVRKRYALLQTPDFVGSYILDKTLTLAIRKFGIRDTKLIDPTCGSGHFLLDAFDRLFRYRILHEPGVDARFAAKDAAESLAGADINPYAIFITRFRLTIAYIEKGDYKRLREAPSIHLKLAVADSLLINKQQPQMLFGDQIGRKLEEWEGALFALADPKATEEVLGRRYAAVVGNPPYITVKDAALREAYRKLYPKTCSGKYSLAAPFMERFFQLGRQGAQVGMITANSFMKREFGAKLIEEYLPKVNLTTIVNTSGAYIPGHGTPTVLLFGTAEPPPKDGLKDTVRTVLASRGEPSTPEDPENGLVWRSIVEHGDEVGFENDYISVTETPREDLKVHPWSLGGGGATDLKALLEDRAESTLGEVTDSIGIASFTLEDDVYLRPRQTWTRANVPAHRMRPMVTGECIRDWSVEEDLVAFFPYDGDFVVISDDDPELRALWPWRTNLSNNLLFGGKTKIEGGLRWHEFGRLTANKLRTPLTITFAFVATHNHFVLDRGGKVFNRSAPIIKLPASATEDDHYALLAYLNSSTALFLMRQVFAPKGMNNASDSNSTPYLQRFEFDGTKLKSLPLPYRYLAEKRTLARLGRRLDELARERSRTVPTIGADYFPRVVEEMIEKRGHLWELEIGVQEEIDWVVYRSYGLLDSEIAPSEYRLSLGQRVFEQLLHDGSEYFRWHDSKRGGCPSAVTALWDERKRAVKASRDLQLLESPECKRRWIQAAGKAAQELQSDSKSVRDYVCQEIDNRFEAILRQNQGIFARQNALIQAANSAELRDAIFWAHRHDTATFLGGFLHGESIPFLAAHRYTASGLEKHAAWQHTWDLQRREDAGEKVGEIPVPPKYDQKDFRSGSYWSLRGKLDVPKERFISYPGCESDEDGEPVYGWAGWNHRQRAVALATLYGERKNDEGWGKDRLAPMLAGILELLPWLGQWHNEPDAEFDGAIPAVQFREFLDAQCAELGLTYDDLRAWRPAEKKRAAKKTAAKKVSKHSAKQSPSEEDASS